MASVTFEHINKTYENNVTIVPDLNLKIKDKEFLVLVGPSGCGKSTTLRMIAGLESITSGNLYIDKTIVNDIPPKDRDIAMVFQSYALYPHMTVYKNLAFSLSLKKMSKSEIDNRVKDVAKKLDIEKYLNRKPKALSGGQRQRVALGRAMVRHPKVFLLDEPLSNLDAKLRGEMRTQISRLHKELDTTFVYVTHDQTEAMTMGDRIAVLKDGVLQQIDTPNKIYAHPTNMFVATFIGMPQMNMIETQIIENNGTLFAAIENYTIPLPLRMQNNPDVRKYINKTVIYGIRPENVSMTDEIEVKGGYNKIKIPNNLAEMMGSEIYIHSSLGGSNFIARIPSLFDVCDLKEIELYINTEYPHLFDPDTEKVICD